MIPDPFFGAPSYDVDERRETPAPHRYVHGSFAGTDTRFAISLPDRFEGRLVQFLQGGLGGSESAGALFGAPGLAFDLGAVYVESNQGHIGNDMSGLRGDDTILGWRASARTAELARALAREHYGTPIERAYVLGGSGGGMRSIDCLEHRPDLWDGAVPFMINRPGLFTYNFSLMEWAAARLAPHLPAVTDALAPGGSGDPRPSLPAPAREALDLLWRGGFPRGAEADLQPHPLVALGMRLARIADPAYFEEFWSVPGHAGADAAPELDPLRIAGTATVREVVPMSELAKRMPAFGALGAAASILGGGDAASSSALVVETDLARHRLLGATLHLAGRNATCSFVLGDILMAAFDPGAFAGLRAGDSIEIENRDWIAFAHYHRHIAADEVPEMAAFVRDGKPIHRPRPRRAERLPSGRFEGKMILLQHALDREAWPSGADAFVRDVRAAYGDAMDERLRIWWIESAGHLPPFAPARTTTHIPYAGFYSQALRDVVAWVEAGVAPPPSTGYTFDDERALRLYEGAAARRGIQPVIRLERDRIDVRAGEPFTLRAEVEVPSGAGELAEARWDVSGDGSFPIAAEVSGRSATVALTHRYDAAGSRFVTLRVFGHRDGANGNPRYRTANLARARIVVS